MADSLLVGSAAWTGGEEYRGEYSERINQFIDTINQEALLAYASRLRENRPCTISCEFSVGNFNLVRKIHFDDGIEWVARLRMPPMPGQDSKVLSPAPEAELGRRGVLFDMQSELATMEFVRQNTDIPIPEVYAYDLTDQNSVGCPFSIIEYIHGNTAEEVSRTYPGEHEGIPAQFKEKFWRQVARVIIQLASIRMPKIGSIIRSSVGSDSFVIGPLVETGSGPYNSAAEFYADYPLALNKILREGELPVRGQEQLVQAFQSLAVSFPLSATRAEHSFAESFGLANYDLNPNNILVDREFNILAIIDWDSVFTVPEAALYRFPFLMGISCAIPGVVDTHPAVVKRQQLSRRFAEIVEAVSRQQSQNDCGDAKKWRSFLPTKAGFFSKESIAFRSLVYVKMRQSWVNHMWLQGLKWLNEHNETEVAQFYLQEPAAPPCRGKTGKVDWL